MRFEQESDVLSLVAIVGTLVLTLLGNEWARMGWGLTTPRWLGHFNHALFSLTWILTLASVTMCVISGSWVTQNKDVNVLFPTYTLLVGLAIFLAHTISWHFTLAFGIQDEDSNHRKHLSPADRLPWFAAFLVPALIGTFITYKFVRGDGKR